MYGTPVLMRFAASNTKENRQLSAAWYVTLLEIEHLLSSFLQYGGSCI